MGAYIKSKKFVDLIVFVSVFNELCNLYSGCVPEGEDVVNEWLPDERAVKPL